MKRAASLIPEIHTMPQCMAQRTGNYMNDRLDTDRQCRHHAKFMVDGKFYCTKHAGVVALKILISESIDKSESVV